MIKAIIFDMDGLMVDTERLYHEADDEIAVMYDKRINFDVTEKMMGQKPLVAIEIFREFLGADDITAEELLEKRNRIFLEMLNNDLVPMKGLSTLLDTFKDRLLLAIATGATGYFTDIILERLGIKEYFHIIQTSDDISKGKPDPEIYLKTASRLNFSPEDCVVLEDSGNGVLAAKTAGCHVIAVPSEYTVNHDFTMADYIARDLVDCRKYLINKISGSNEESFEIFVED